MTNELLLLGGGFAVLGRELLVALGDRHSSSEAEGAAGDFQAGGGLAALVFAAIDELDDAGDSGPVETFLDNLTGAFFFLDVAVEDRVEKVVGRERILIGLIGA